MPNHCSNWLTVEGPKDDLSNFIEAVTGLDKDGEVQPLDFNGTVPMPKELENTLASSRADANKTVKVIKGDQSFNFISNCPICRHANVSDEDVVNCSQCNNDYVNPKEIVHDKTAEENTDAELTMKYGAKNWYDWKVAHWGTKWGAYDTIVECQTETSIQYSFTTANCPGVEWLEATAAKFPNLKFSLTYEELGMCFHGEFTVQGEDVIEQWEDEISEDEIREKYPDLYDEQDMDSEKIVSEKDK